jgi:hypothetical protein
VRSPLSSPGPVRIFSAPGAVNKAATRSFPVNLDPNEETPKSEDGSETPTETLPENEG